MLNKVKRLLCLMLCTALLCTLAVAPATAADNSNYALNETFEDTPEYFANNTVEYDFGGVHGKVRKLNIGSSADVTTSATGLSTDGRNFIFNADIYFKGEVTPVNVVLKGKDASGNAVSNTVSFSATDIKVNNGGKQPFVQSKANTWHNVMIYCKNRVAEGKAYHGYHFVDGISAREASTVYELSSIEITAPKSSSSGEVYIDNVSVLYDGADSFFADVNYEDGNVTVTTSNLNTTAMSGWDRGACNGFSGTKLIETATGKEISWTQVSQSGNKLVMKPDSELTPDTKEYMVKLPDALKPFAPGSGNSNNCATAIVSKEIKFGENKGEVIPPSGGDNENDDNQEEDTETTDKSFEVDEDFNTGEGIADFTSGHGVADAGGRYGKVMQLYNTTDENQGYKTTSRKFETGGNDQIVMFDIYLGQSDIQYALDVKGTGGTNLAYFLFTQHGYVAAGGSGADISGYTADKVAAIKSREEKAGAVCSSGEWHKIVMYYDLRSTGTFDYVWGFIDGKRFCQYGINRGTVAGIETISFVTPKGAVSQGKTCYIDNVIAHDVTTDSFCAEIEQDNGDIIISLSEMLAENLTDAFNGMVITEDKTGTEIEYDIISQDVVSCVIRPETALKMRYDYTITLHERVARFTGGGENMPSSALASRVLKFTPEQGVYTELYAEPIGIKDKVSADVTEITSALKGATVYANATLVNPFEAQEEVLVMLMAYNNYEMSTAVSGEYKVGGMTSVDIKDISIAVGSDENLTLKVVALQKEEKGYKIIASKVISNVAGEFTEADNSFVYSGKAVSGNKDIIFELTEEGKTDVIYTDVITSEADGSYAIGFNMPEKYKSGPYSLTVYEQDSDAVTYSVTYVNKNERASAISAIKDGTKAVEDILEESSYLLIDSEIAEELDYSKTADLIEDYIKDAELLTDEEVLQVVRKASYTVAAADGILDNIFDYAEELELDDSSIGDFYDKKYVGSAVWGYITDGVKGCDVETFEDFDEALTEAFVLAVVRKPDGTDNLKEVLNAFADEIGISEDASDSVYRALQGEVYSDYSELKKAFNDAKAEKKSSSGGGGGGGGRSTLANVNDSIVSADIIEEAEPILINIFEDIEDDFWGKTAIVALAQKGIINGKGDGCFYPDDNITREEFVKIVVTTLGCESKGGKADFSDVDANAWYYPYVSTAVENGLVTGYDDGRFGVGENISRQDMCVILYRAATLSGYEFKSPSEATFSDYKEISEYALDSVNVLTAEGIVNGYETGEFKPLANSTRAECSAMIYNFLDLFNQF